MSRKKTASQLNHEISEVLATPARSNPFEDAKDEVALLEKELHAANEVLKDFPRDAMGLIPDAVALTQEYRSAKARFQKAFARIQESKQAPLKPHWTTLETDRDGKPTIRVWRLPRTSHPGMAVWDTPRNASRGRYEVMVEVRAGGLGQRSSGGTYGTTRLRFRNLDELSQYIRETSQL